jgi:phage terminase small subunit
VSVQGLTPRQERFVSEYLLDLNASAAALRAGYKHPDIGRQLLTKTHVQDAIAAAQQARARRLEITTDQIVQALRAIATDYENAPHGVRVSALAWLGKHLGMFSQKVQHQFPAHPIRIIEVVRDPAGGAEAWPDQPS